MTVLCAAYASWLVLLAWQSPAGGLASGSGPGRAMAALDAVQGMVERHAAAHCGYPSTGGAWVLVADGDSGDLPGGELPELLGRARPFADPAVAPPTSIIYASDGKEYKLIAHTADRELCLRTRRDAPARVDMARLEYTTGFLRGPSWAVIDHGEQEGVGRLMRARRAGAALPDPNLGQELRGTCWAFGYWSPGAALW